MPQATRFRARALIGYAVIIALLVVGMVVTIGRMEDVSDGQIAYIRTEERDIGLVERLRWSGELMVSSGRGYLISGDGEFLEKLREAEADFNHAVRSLEHENVTPKVAALIAEVDRAATDFHSRQDALLEQRESGPPGAILARFESEVLPARFALSGALDRLVRHKGDVIERIYREAGEQRAHLMAGEYGLLAILVIVGVGAAWYFASKLEQAYRREADALETTRRALIARDDLMGIVAHDLRNPLGAIMMKAELVEQLVHEGRVRSHAQSIHSIATRMAELIKATLDVTTIEAGRFAITPERCDVDALVHEALDVFGPLATSRQVTLELEVMSDGIVIHGDRERLFQVLSNLLGNALKFTPPGGRVTLRVERVSERVRFSVVDTGAVIPAENVPLFFDRYWKLVTRGL
ncbi:MAG: ATP-binding protein [Kofleriaceae bacterium]